MRQSGNRFRLDPDPPVAGQPLSVRYVGPASEIEWQVDDGKAQRVKPDKNGRFEIERVPGGKEIMLSDGTGLAGYRHATIVHYR